MNVKDMKDKYLNPGSEFMLQQQAKEKKKKEEDDDGDWQDGYD